MFNLINNINTNWKEFIDKEFEQEYFKKIINRLEIEKQIIYPSSDKVFRAFNFFNIEDTKIVIFGQDPYHGDEQANGLAFSVERHIKNPPSLINIFKKLNIDLGISRQNGDLSDWAQQGMLLLNTSLTVIKDEARSLSNIGWINFIKNVIFQLNNVSKQKIIFVLLGNDAFNLEQYIDTNKHVVVKSCHPSPLSANRCGFFTTKLFDIIDEQFFIINNIKFKWI